jgi:hypothetical protein
LTGQYPSQPSSDLRKAQSLEAAVDTPDTAEDEDERCTKPVLAPNLEQFDLSDFDDDKFDNDLHMIQQKLIDAYNCEEYE